MTKTIRIMLHDQEERHVVVPVDAIVRLGKRPDLDADDPPTMVVLEHESFLSGDSMRTIEARAGGGFRTLSGVGDDWPSVVALSKIVLLRKLREEMDGDDPTVVHLTNGETVLTTDSIRTLDASLKLGLGVEALAIDIPGTNRPASLVPGFLRIIGENVDDAGPHVAVLEGDWTIEFAGASARLTEAMEKARAEVGEGRPSP